MATQSMTMTGIKLNASILFGVLAFVMLLLSFDVYSLTFTGGYKFGAVYTRSIVPGPSGKPVYVEFDEAGNEVTEIAEANGEWEDLIPMGADIFLGHVVQFELAKEKYTDADQTVHYEAVTRDEFFAQSFTTIDGKPIPVSSEDIKYSTVYLLIRKVDERYVPEASQLVLHEMPVNPTATPSPGSKSLLITKKGVIKYESPNNIGFRVGFFGTEEDPVSDAWNRERDHTIYGPLQDVLIDVPVGIGGKSITGSDGKFSFGYWLPPCPGFIFEFNTTAFMELRYRVFSPRGRLNMPYFLSKPDWEVCNGLADTPGLPASIRTALIAIDATLATAIKQPMDFKVDIMAATGKSLLTNDPMPSEEPDPDLIQSFASPIPIGDSTQYNSDRLTLQRTAQKQTDGTYLYDFDGDGEGDKAELGKIVIDPITEEKSFETSAQEIQGVWLSSLHDYNTLNTAETLPDLTRIPDWNADVDGDGDFIDRGLLSEISLDDLKNTDLYIFRESDGTLLAERIGLNNENTRRLDFVGVDEENDQRFSYAQYFLNSEERFYTASLGRSTFQDMQEGLGFIDERFYERREVDHIRQGENIRIMAINRATGYMGSVVKALEPNSTETIAFVVRDIEMRPPNLKIWAERYSEVKHGLTKGDINDYMVGNEGAGLSDDQKIVIYTEFFDQDGYALPEEFAEYGFTGRIAQVVAPNQLAAVSGGFDECSPACDGNNLSQFTIKPGRQAQVVRLPEEVLGKQHLYIQVSGEPSTRNPDFSSSGIQQGILQHRPDKYVPFMVPVFDEQNTHLQVQAYNTVKIEDPSRELEYPEPFYQWVYRPEYQFSVYELEVAEVRRTDVLNETENLLEAEQPVITSSDQLIEVFYDLNTNKDPQLEAYSFQNERELVFALGEEEVKAQVNVDDETTVAFENLEHLSSLNPEDYLTLRLYANNDAGNILWEWAYEFLAIDTLYDIEEYVDEEGVINLPADNLELPLQAILVGYADRDPELKKEVRLVWKVEGTGDVDPAVQTDKNLGIFNTLLTMPKSTGSTATIKAYFDSGGDVTESVFGKIKVVPGKPHTITINTTGEASAMGYGEMSVTATVKDQHGNNVADGTPVSFSVSGGAEIVDSSTAAIGGLASATIIGGNYTTPENILYVSSGEASAQESFVIHPLNLTLVSLEPAPKIGVVSTATFRLTDKDGAAVSNKQIKAGTTYGIVKNSTILTNAEGTASTQVINPPYPGAAELTARAGLSTYAKQSYDVGLPSGYIEPKANTRKALVVGDQSVAGTLTHNRFDGVQIEMDYPVSTSVPLTGIANESLTAELGDLDAPNLAPMAAYYMTELVPNSVGLLSAPDEVGLNTAASEGVTVVEDHPLGVGHSYHFDSSNIILGENKPSRLFVDNITTLAKANNTSFRVDVKPESYGATIFDFHNGSIKLTIDAVGRIRYQITTTSGAYEVSSDPVNLNQWHSIAGRYQDGTLSLLVDGVAYAVGSIVGDYHYTGTSSLEIGNGYNGNISALLFYDWASQPLLAFEGGTSATSVTLDASGQGGVSVSSLGNLNAQHIDSSISMLSVAIRVGTERHTVSLLSSALYTEIGGFYVDAMHPDAPPINYAALSGDYDLGVYKYTQPVLNYLISPAYALSLSDIGNWVAEAVNFFIPYKDIGMMFEQLYYLAMDDPKFKEEDLVSGLIGTLSIIPVAKGLKLAKPLVKFVMFAKKVNPKFMGRFISVLDKTLEKAWAQRSLDVFIDMLPFILIVVDLINDDEARKGLEFLAKSVVSDEDLQAWIDYFRLPTDGWIGGEDEMPELELVDASGVHKSDTMFAMMGVSTAHAALTKGKQLSSAKAKDILKYLSRLGGDVVGADDFKKVMSSVSELPKALKKTDWYDVRKLAHKPEWIQVGVAGTANAIRQTLKKNDNYMRVSPVAMGAIVAYLESRKTCSDGAGASLPNCTPLEEQVKKKLAGLYARAFSENIIASNKDKIGGWEKGHQFQLALLAALHFSYEVSDNEADKIIDVEVSGDERAKVWLYDKDGTGVEPYGTSFYGREPDIVLAGKAGNTLVSSPDSIWIECKSWSYKKGTKPDTDRIKPWRLSQKSESNAHRQMFLDRVARVTHDKVPSLSKDFKWYFQKFNRKSIQGYTDTDIKKTRDALRKLPEIKQSVALASLGYNNLQDNVHTDVRKYFEANVKAYSIREWLLGTGRGMFDQFLDSDQIEEFIAKDDVFDLGFTQ